jgi:uncharacterized protein
VQRALVISIHDVAPSTRTKVEQIINELARHGVHACSLLVVPDYHRQGPSLSEPAFCSWLHQLAANGHEIVIHGFFHQRTRRKKEQARVKIVTRIYTDDEGEFFDLGYEEALHLIQEARTDFENHGFHPTGFIAPAWLLGAEAKRAVIDAGMKYTTTLRAVRDLASGRIILSQSLVYSVRSGWRRFSSLIWNRSLFRSLTSNPLLRLGIHPPDIDYPAVWKQIGELIAAALRDRRAMTYQGWLSEQSAISSPRDESVRMADNQQSAIQ